MLACRDQTTFPASLFLYSPLWLHVSHPKCLLTALSVKFNSVQSTSVECPLCARTTQSPTHKRVQKPSSPSRRLPARSGPLLVALLLTCFLGQPKPGLSLCPLP